jgi:hypothetical protein
MEDATKVAKAEGVAVNQLINVASAQRRMYTEYTQAIVMIRKK